MSEIDRLLKVVNEVEHLVCEDEELLREALVALEQTYIHCEELRDAWERGALDEHDGKGGTRSNRNYTVVLSVRAAITKLEERLLET